ncbi:hypothetical protein DY000_02032431 [Brassica cretica]|uniref:Uncharacterized protein n=1 Tax=Brassica cretica TaxID=69181 RepID=A0ABQ7DTS2_BRACR|nr:hypothetical protein DY000_02032431 [Brassica cretica]
MQASVTVRRRSTLCSHLCVPVFQPLINRSLKYIPELQEEVKKLIQKKEELLVRVSGQRDIEHHVKQQPKVVVCYVSTVSVTRLGDNEVMVQISSSKIHSFWISNVLSGLEEDGFCSCGCFIAKVSW